MIYRTRYVEEKASPPEAAELRIQEAIAAVNLRPWAGAVKPSSIELCRRQKEVNNV